jgi:hypothetical protein
VDEERDRRGPRALAGLVLGDAPSPAVGERGGSAAVELGGVGAHLSDEPLGHRVIEVEVLHSCLEPGGGRWKLFDPLGDHESAVTAARTTTLADTTATRLSTPFRYSMNWLRWVASGAPPSVNTHIRSWSGGTLLTACMNTSHSAWLGGCALWSAITRAPSLRVTMFTGCMMWRT